jgi:multiple sugar transport system ATP-binding protein
MAHVELQALRKAFGRTEVVRGVDLVLASGELTTIVGPSGCGKSTLLRLVAGLEQPTSGRVLIDGEDVTARAPKDRGVAMVFQSYALYPHKTVRGNLAFPLEIAGEKRGAIEGRVRETAERLGIEDLLGRYPRELSGGQRQRVALGRALVRRPRLCLFDEPLSNLDAALRNQVRVEIKKLHEELGATFVYVTHDQVEAMTLSDRIVVLDRGRVRQVGAPRDLYEAPADTFVASFVGSPAINLVPPSALGLGARAGLVAGARPDDVTVGPAAGADAARGPVWVVEPVGPVTWVTVEVEGTRVTGRADAAFWPKPGDVAAVTVDEARVLWFDEGTGRRVAG